MTQFYKVKNKLNTALTLIDGLGDEVQVPPLSTYPVEARFLDFQMPPIQQAEVLGYDYFKASASNVASPPTVQSPSVVETEDE